jgi:SPP1 gp7 family putative phage head morphogenesis protein
MKRLASPTGKAITLAAVRPNAGLQAIYRKRLDKLIDAMHRDVLRRIERAWKQRPPEMAQDAPDGGYGRSPARNLIEEIGRLGREWQARFDEAAPKLARYFASQIKDRADGALAAILKTAGFTVEFKMSARANDVFQATVGEQVGLIKSIASEHLADVQGAVMRSVQAGRDLGSLSKEIEERYGVTKRRAALIARDQTNKATATITRVRQTELGITHAVWVHSAGGKKPRASHVAADGKTYEIAKGMKIDGDFILPGQLVNCRCVSRSVIPGFE